MAKIKIKKIRSEIRRPGDQKKTLLALGLKKIGQVVSCTKNIGLIAMKDKSYLKEKFFKENSEEIYFLNIEST